MEHPVQHLSVKDQIATWAWEGHVNDPGQLRQQTAVHPALVKDCSGAPGLRKVQHGGAPRVQRAGPRLAVRIRGEHRHVLVRVQFLGCVARALLLQPPLHAHKGHCTPQDVHNGLRAAQLADCLLDRMARRTGQRRALVAGSKRHPKCRAENAVVFLRGIVLRLLLQTGSSCLLHKAQQLPIKSTAKDGRQRTRHGTRPGSQDCPDCPRWGP
mmetsp:Transcript_25280/g.57430  ORF Transcript_25280/g.57430 Transcript_25280/m.57430 type:complete len:212 (+) Transcript_25280:295-930(+)